MSDEPPPAGDGGDEQEIEEPKETVPETLNLPLFWQNDRLSDCLIKLPAAEASSSSSEEKDTADAGGDEGAPPAEEVSTHYVSKPCFLAFEECECKKCMGMGWSKIPTITYD